MKKSRNNLGYIIINIMICLLIISNRSYAKDSTAVSTRVYKSIGDKKLKVHIFYSPNFIENNKHPAFIIFMAATGFKGLLNGGIIIVNILHLLGWKPFQLNIVYQVRIILHLSKNYVMGARVSQDNIGSVYDRIAPIYEIWGKLTESNARSRAIELAAIKAITYLKRLKNNDQINLVEHPGI